VRAAGRGLIRKLGDNLLRMRILLLCVILSYSPLSFAQQNGAALTSPSGVTGIVKRHEKFSSKFVDARNVDVWLPPGYERNKSKRFPVLYMHDGQNLFDPKLSYIGVDWGIDETMTRLISEGMIREAIVVGVWNTPKRLAEYLPRKAFPNTAQIQLEGLPTLQRDQIASDDYLKFLVDELKPFIDATYRTLPDRKNTLIMGSSMGGLISAYAISEYPNIFGGAGCISTHWPLGNGIVIDYLKQHLPEARTHKFYFDYGTETLDANYEPYQQKMDEVMRSAGYKEGTNWETRKFVGAEHSERAWSKRVDQPLTFFLHK
jgi:predicted alpha/beta superfamily hydrolase